MIQTKAVGSLLVTTPEGPVRLGEHYERLRTLLRSQLDDGHKFLLLDLGLVTQMDSSGVGLMVEAKAHAINRGGDLRLCNVPNSVYTILSRLMLHEILHVYETEEAAVGDWK